MQGYQNPPPQFYYSGRVNEPTERATVYDLDILDLNRRSPDTQQQKEMGWVIDTATF